MADKKVKEIIIGLIFISAIITGAGLMWDGFGSSYSVDTLNISSLSIGNDLMNVVDDIQVKLEENSFLVGIELIFTAAWEGVKLITGFIGVISSFITNISEYIGIDSRISIFFIFMAITWFAFKVLGTFTKGGDI